MDSLVARLRAYPSCIVRTRDHALAALADDIIEAADEITALRERVAALEKANREAVELIDEINKRAATRKFWGISQTIHAKLCTVRITLARAALTAAVGEGK